MYIKRNAYEKEDNEETPLNHSEMMKILPLAKLAYNGLVANQKDPNHAQLAFDEDDLTTAGVSDKDCWCTFHYFLRKLNVNDIIRPYPHQTAS